MQEHESSCAKGAAGTSLVWSDLHQNLFGCMYNQKKDSVKFKAYQINYDASPKVFEGGKFENDSLFRVEVDGLIFQFFGVEQWSWYNTLFGQKVYEGIVSDENYKYDPYIEKKHFSA